MTGKPEPGATSEETAELRRRLQEAEDTIRALVRGEVDAVGTAGEHGEPMLLAAAQEALGISETQYRALFRGNPLPILILEAGSGRFLAVNAAAERHYGWSEDQFRRMDAADIRPDEDVEDFRRYLAEPLREAQTTVWRHRKADGSDFLAEVTIQATSFQGTPARMAIVKDVTEERRADDLVRRSEERFRALVERSSEVVLIMRPDGRITYVSPAVESVLGYTPREHMEGYGLFERVHPDDRRRLESLGALCLRTPGKEIRADFRYRHADGSWRELMATGVNRVDDPAVGGVVVNVRDVTEARRAERERNGLLVREQEARAEAEAAHLRLTDILESITDTFFACDESWRFTYVNGGAERLTGCRRTELLGRVLWEVFPRLVGTEWDRAMRRVVETGGPVSMEERVPGGRLMHVRAYPWRGGVAVYLQDITDARRAQQDLDQFFALTVDVLAVLDTEGVFRRMNPAVESVLGYPPDQIVGHSFTDFVHPDDVGRSLATAEGVRDGRPIRGFENRYRRADGTWCWLSWTVTAPVDGLMYGVARDVTGRKLDERLAAGQQAVLEMIATGQPVDRVLGAVADLCREGAQRVVCGVQEWDAGQGTLRHRAARGLPHELVARLDVTGGGVEGVAAEVVRRNEPLVTRDMAHDPHWAGLRDETLRHGLRAAWLFPLEGPGGAPVGVLGLYAAEPRELSAREQRLVHVVIRLANIALTRHRSEERRRLLQQAVSQLSDIVMITEAHPLTEPGPRIVFVNEGFERLTGYSAEEVLGRTPRILQGPKSDPETRRRMREGLAAHRRVNERVLNYTKDGREIWLDTEIVPIEDDEGRHTHWVAVERDVTERKALEEQLLQSQKMEAVGRLAGGIAHDFNNLLTIMLGSAQILLEEMPADEPARQDLTEIAEAARRASALTRQLLAFSRKQVMNPRVMDLNELVRGLHGMLVRVIGEDVRLVAAASEEACTVRADPAQLEQVLLNLAVNARDAMEQGDRLEIATDRAVLDQASADRHPDARPGTYAVLRVSDTGHGMAPAVLDRIFEPFFTTKESGKGTGLGLATVFGIVQQSGGFIDVTSQPGAGTTFSVFLPAVDEPVEPRGPTTRPARRGGSETILVVEDEEAVRRFVRRVLERLGYRVLEAAGGEEALEILAAAQHVDMMLADVVMPGMSGVRLAERLREVAPDLRVLFMSGYSHDEVAGRGIRSLGAELVDKPLSVQALGAKVREVLERI